MLLEVFTLTGAAILLVLAAREYIRFVRSVGHNKEVKSD